MVLFFDFSPKRSFSLEIVHVYQLIIFLIPNICGALGAHPTTFFENIENTNSVMVRTHSQRYKHLRKTKIILVDPLKPCLNTKKQEP